MPDDNKTVNIDIQVVGNAEQKLKTIEQQLRANKVAQDALLQANVSNKISGVQYQEQLLVLQNKELDLIKLKERLESNYASTKKKAAEEQAEINRKVAEAQQRIAEANTAALEKEKLRQQTGNPALERQQIARASGVSHAQSQSTYNDLFGEKQQVQMLSYAKQLSNLNKLQEHWYQLANNTGDQKYTDRYNAVGTAIDKVSAKQKAFNKTIGDSDSYLGSFAQKFRSHFNWLLTGAIMGVAAGSIIETFNTLKELETEFNTLKTVSEEMRDNQFTYNAVVKQSFELAERYGLAIKNVTEGLRLWGRGYKDLSEAQKLNEIAMKLSVADNFSPEVAVRAIESVVSSYGKQGEAVQFATHVMDSMTKVSHNAQISAQDLSEALLRSGAAAHTVGVSFDELSAMIGVIARNTGLSGQTIGDGIKSVLNSIHSDKAITELNKMGVEVYKVGTNGEKEFRKISDVLLDVALKAPIAGQNIEKAFRDLAGGKFQVTKLSALLGDPNEYIRLLGQSINSAGFTDKQLLVQMDTIQRKAETLKTSLEQMIVSGGDSGLTSSIKSFLDALNQIIKGLNSIDSSVYNAAGSFAGLGVAIMAARAGISLLVSGYTAIRTVTLSATTAQEAYNVAIVANPWGAIAKLVLVAATAFATYAYFAGEAANAQEKAVQKQSDLITAKQSEIEMNKQQIGFMETLGNTYVQLQDNLQAVAGDQQKVEAVEKTMGVVYKELAAIVGETAAQRIVASDDIKGAITEEQKIHAEKTTQMETALGELRTTQIKLMRAAVDASNDRIGAINNEATSVDLAANAIATSLGKIDAAFYKYYKGKAQYMRDTASMMQGIKDQWDDLPVLAQVGLGQYQEAMTTMGVFTPENAEAIAKDAEDEAAGYREKALAAEFETQRKATGDLGGLYNPKGSYNTTPGSTGEVSDDDGKKKNGSSRGSGGGTDPSISSDNRVLRDMYTMAQQKMFHTAKLSADQYANSLELLSTKETIFGTSVYSANTRVAQMDSRIGQLQNTQHQYNNEAEYLGTILDNNIDKDEDLKQSLADMGITWGTATKEQKKEFRELNSEFLQNHKNIKEITKLLENYESKASDTTKEIIKLTSEIQRMKYAGTYDPEKLFSREKSVISSLQEQALSEVNKNDPFAYLQKRAINLEATLQQVETLERHEADLKNQLSNAKVGTDDYNNVSDKLRGVQTELAKTRENAVDLKDVFYDIRSGYADIVSDILIQNQSLGQIWKKQWNNLANDAIKALLKIQNNSPSLLTQIFGLFGGKAAANSGYNFSGISVGTPIKIAHSGEYINSFAPKMHTGGIAGDGLKDDEVLRTLQKGELVINKDATKKLLSGEGYVPSLSNPEKVNSAVDSAAANNARLESLSNQQNQLMMQQNEMLAQGLSNGGSNGQVIVVNAQASGADIAKALQQNPEIITSLLRKEKSLNRW